MAVRCQTSSDMQLPAISIYFQCGISTALFSSAWLS